MKESINTALSWIKSNATMLNLFREIQTVGKNFVSVQKKDETDNQVSRTSSVRNLLESFDLHVHFPAAATPKDGPSAGVTIATALVSLFTGRRVRSNFAMTGEISLQGLVLPVGGIKEKVMAAHRNGVEHVILPKKNEKDIADVPDDLRAQVKIHFV